MTEPPAEPAREVDANELRRLFSEARIEERRASGELTTVVKYGTERAAPDALGEPPGTVSHILVYLDGDGRAQAMVHEYLRPDGTIGASGMRDPKWLRTRGVKWSLRRW